MVGTLYFQKKDHADLVRKKYLYFAETVRRLVQVDLEETENDSYSFARIARRTGMDSESISTLIHEVRHVAHDTSIKISAERMKQLIDRMNDITRNLL